MKRVGVLALSAFAVMSVALVATAFAHSVRFDTAITAKYNAPAKKDPNAVAVFNGTVTSAKVLCQQNRTVNLEMRQADGTTTLVGTDVSDAAGLWTISQTNFAPGTYFVKAPKDVLLKNKKHRHVCRAGVSKDLKVK